ncbi:hypothetical protein ACNQT2_11680, partial [Corynebacterium diphtheriae]
VCLAMIYPPSATSDGLFTLRLYSPIWGPAYYQHNINAVCLAMIYPPSATSDGLFTLRLYSPIWGPAYYQH